MNSGDLFIALLLAYISAGEHDPLGKADSMRDQLEERRRVNGGLL